ncbi:MAG TPA: DUF4124 domain-containing protein [Steroidobacteraceae bacterium]|jgi:hypothetical protein|nr:DUF4124 domain-containing protein [Steroidobacteraceae bacterium]
MRRILFTLMWIGCSLALAGTVYKWTDENGVVHYSDQPHPNAQKIQVQAAQTYKAPAADTAAASGPGAPTQPATPGAYRGCAVVQPQDDSTFANIDSLTVVVQTDPVLRPGDQVFVTLDGEALNGKAATGSTFTLSPVDRGTHTLQAMVRGADGSMLCQAPSVTFHVHQPSLQNPVNPVRPH